MYKRILVPTDCSDTATAGLREAIKLAKGQNAQIRLLHVVDASSMIPAEVYGPLVEQIIAEARAAGESVLASARALVEDAAITVDAQLVEARGGYAGEHILNAAQTWPADIIVCGTHGRRGLRRIIMGSDAEFIVRRSSVPVLLVRAEAVHEQE
jgi:nucleotide-binding universal stress UspA family protein